VRGFDEGSQGSLREETVKSSPAREAEVVGHRLNRSSERVLADDVDFEYTAAVRQPVQSVQQRRLVFDGIQARDVHESSRLARGPADGQAGRPALEVHAERNALCFDAQFSDEIRDRLTRTSDPRCSS
jgi:hypothetical protein